MQKNELLARANQEGDYDNAPEQKKTMMHASALKTDAILELFWNMNGIASPATRCDAYYKLQHTNKCTK